MNPFTTTRADSVVAYGELRLIDEIRRWLGNTSPKTPFGIGDDCAVIPPTKRSQLVTTDPVIYGRHFDDSVKPRDVGAKLLKRNLSDIAAMGGKPIAAVIALALPPQTNVAWLREFYHGLAATARRYRVKIVGGDITQGSTDFLGAFLTLHGESAPTRVVTRSGARAGDHIYVTGTLGGSLRGHHYDFTPRLREGAWLAARPEVRAMMDVSDGVAKDIESLTPSSLAPALLGSAIPIGTDARKSAAETKQTPLFHALCDGEDYELLVVMRRDAASPARFERDWRRRFPRLKLTRIGTFFASKALPADALSLADYRGYEHLR